ncbi:MAG TPA: dTDP-4-dehydrorhamnose 3,5-epimerase family protein, partial [Candidatus Limnocylindria bacterium]|nr:dTDP-4-dehydrorhamnose 3,5-epimerase family protein [Candidatus Limnocylindria bacterium]
RALMRIDGVETKALVRHADERGYFLELARLREDPFFADPGVAQVSTAVRLAGLVAWHLHPTQVDWWWVAEGDLQVALLDRRPASGTFNAVDELRMGERSDQGFVLRIPAGVAHGYRVLAGPVRMVYLASRTYDPSEELRLDPADPELARLWDWTKPARL